MSIAKTTRPHLLTREAAAARIEALEAALHEAFMAMCAYRDNKDEEVFQDAIDALGLALAPEPSK